MLRVMSRRLLVTIAWLAGVALLAGCSQVPNMDAGSAGCQNARGIGVASDDSPEILAQVEGLSAAEAWNKMKAQGHTVVFNTGDCWCVPPPGGKVSFAWFGQHGALHLMVDGVDPALTPGDPPFLGYGC
jgi:hypothetical protein